MPADLFVKGARVVKPDAVVDCGLLIRDGVIAGLLAPGETVDARRTVDAGGRYVLPGLLDTHLHLGTAAQSFAADCRSESRHAVTGGVTTLLPFVITRGSYVDALPEMQRAVVTESLVDMVFHAIIIREGQIEEIPRLADELGVRSFKTFMAYKGREISPSGIQGMGDAEIFSVFRQVAKVPGGIAIVHCENMELIYPRKGALEVGSDADLVIVDLDREVKVDLATLNSVVDFSPYDGWVARGWADTTIAGGQVVYEGGEVVAVLPRGRYLGRRG